MVTTIYCPSETFETSCIVKLQTVWSVMQSIQVIYKIEQYVHHEQENQEIYKSPNSGFKGPNYLFIYSWKG